MTGNQVRERFLAFMKERGHVIIPSSQLVPENDPTTLFTGSGMQPLVPYLMGESHPSGTRLADSQKCFRAEDIDEVGDNRHTTFFEMLGNWSLGDYFKKEQIPWFYEFLVDSIGLDPARLYVTVFMGDESAGVPRDTESAELWQGLFGARGVSSGIAEMGSEAAGGERGMKEGERIFYYDASKNWWSRAGRPEKMPIGEIGGPDTEVFYDFGTPHDPKFGRACHPNCDCGRFLEIGNSVFMQYVKNADGSFAMLPKQNVDFGGGLERITAASLLDGDVFKVDLLRNVVLEIERLSGKRYEDDTTSFRIITDHIRGAVFMIGDGVYPGNVEQGYFTRRLIRRAVRYADIVGIPKGELKLLAKSVIDTYKTHYENLGAHEADIVGTIYDEETQFRKTLENGLREFNKVSDKGERRITGEEAFTLFTTYGFPIELTSEIAAERGMTVDLDGFKTHMAEHRERSRAGAAEKFKGGLADHSEKVIMYHTATHLLLAALRKELGEHVHQAGSNITGERLRFDFTHPDKLTDETLRKLEAYVNEAIRKNARVSIETLPKAVAEKDPTIEGSFWDRYPDTVKVYTIKDDEGTVYSRELCGGPHVDATGTISGTFKIQKEESSSRGVRRIKATLE
ncbi:MAG TPA: alanine--tRNA ligase [Candidatus Paceibacterota bacterium]|nr:alanine--tRNA ligase [Candidatus Paceibacterota bacterium]